MSEINPQSNMNLATIALLTNVNCRAKLETLDCLNDIKRKQREQMRHEIRFYRKRIMTIFKDILMRKTNPVVTERTKCAFDSFVRVLIDDMKMSDTLDIIQSGLEDENISEGENENDAKSSKENMLSAQQNTDKIITDANGFLSATRTAPNTLDKYVVRKTMDINIPKAKHSQMNETAPTTKVNLKEPSLRTKGVPPKKENVYKDYDKPDGKEGKVENKEIETKVNRRESQKKANKKKYENDKETN